MVLFIMHVLFCLQVECALLNSNLVDNVCVYGCGMEEHTVALIVPNPKHLGKLAEEVSVV